MYVWKHEAENLMGQTSLLTVDWCSFIIITKVFCDGVWMIDCAFSHNRQSEIVFYSVRQQCGINRSHTPLDVTIKILLWCHTFPYFEFDSNFLRKHINFMFFQKLWKKNNPSSVYPCGVRKSHPRGWIFWSGTPQASFLTKISTPRVRFPYPTWILMMDSITLSLSVCLSFFLCSSLCYHK